MKQLRKLLETIDPIELFSQAWNDWLRSLASISAITLTLYLPYGYLSFFTPHTESDIPYSKIITMISTVVGLVIFVLLNGAVARSVNQTIRNQRETWYKTLLTTIRHLPALILPIIIPASIFIIPIVFFTEAEQINAFFELISLLSILLLLPFIFYSLLASFYIFSIVIMRHQVPIAVRLTFEIARHKPIATAIYAVLIYFLYIFSYTIFILIPLSLPNTAFFSSLANSLIFILSSYFIVVQLALFHRLVKIREDEIKKT
ncbi:MAG: hypothetical protein ACOCXQ_00315 [Patescibacteria group bacterium]